MIDEEILAQYTSYDVIEEARNLYYGGNVGTITYEDAGYGIVRIFGSVISEDRTGRYSAEALLDEQHDEILSFSCTCRVPPETPELCPHTAAAIMKYVYEGKERAVFRPSAYSAVQPVTVKDSSPNITELLAGASLVPDDQPGPGRVIPFLNILSPDSISMAVYYQNAGNPPLQILKLAEFLDAMRLPEEERYYHAYYSGFKIENFDAGSLQLLDILKDLNDTVRNNTGTGLRDNVVLSERVVDDVFAVCGDTVRCQFRRPGRQTFRHYPLVEGMPFMDLRLDRENGGYSLFCSGFSFFAGRQSLYIIPGEEQIIYRTGRTDALYRLLSSLSGNASSFISEADLPSFTNSVWPHLKTLSPVQAPDFRPEDYLYPEPVFRLDLDLPYPDTITGAFTVTYGDETFSLPRERAEQAFRSKTAEKKMLRLMNTVFTSYSSGKDTYVLEGSGRIFSFLKTDVHRLAEQMEVRISENLKKLKIRSSPSFSVNVYIKNDLLRLNMTSEELSPEEVAGILSAYSRRLKFYRLKSGEFLDLETDYSQLTDTLDALDISAAQAASSEVSVPLYKGIWLDRLKETEHIRLQRDELFGRLSQRLHDLTAAEAQVPAHLEKIMREYQKKGYSWLSSLRDIGMGALLADEMGLGKTLQVIALLSAWKDRGKTLIVCPASLVYNWANELHRFSPALPYTIISGPAPIRRELIRRAGPDEILITSYNTLQNDAEAYTEQFFDCQVIDEAQYIKNPGTRNAKAAKSIRARFRIALTGTPIENRLGELWSIFDYLLPGLLYGQRRFTEEFEKPILLEHDEEAYQKLRDITSPFILRRRKKDVLNDLPEKNEEIIYAPLEEEQSRIYRAHVQNIRDRINAKTDREFNESRIEILAELMKLRQICCAPSLLYDRYTGNSAKMDVCMELIRSAIEGGHKILVFSQFTSMLDILTLALKKNRIMYHILTGETPPRKRMELIESFQKDEVPVFCISLRAGGTGINLTAADIVIHYDPWWNTAVENQASDRAHRIGQENIVTVYKIILQDTIEERIVELQSGKKELAESILSDERMASASLNKDELLKLL